MKKQLLIITLLIYVALDLSFSFCQYYSTPLDGDLAGGVLPYSSVQNILDDPIGISTIVKGKVYPNPNRFFSHYMLFTYFNKVPQLLQNIINPIDSVYLACALIKLFTHIVLLGLIAFVVARILREGKIFFLVAMVLMTSLFQYKGGFYSILGIIDNAITYVFFYALPIAPLILFFILFYYYSQKKLSTLAMVVLVIFSVLSGPLNVGVVLVWACIAIGEQVFHRVFPSMLKISPFSKRQWAILGFVIFGALYSLFISQNDELGQTLNIPIWDNYAKLPAGLSNLFFTNNFLNIILLVVGFNYVVMNLTIEDESKYLLNRLGIWLLLFSVFYILLLPLGGYRPWRPLIIRYDTLLPVTLFLGFVYVLSILYLMRNHRNSLFKKIYVVFMVLVTGYFTISDESTLGDNQCQKEAIRVVANSKEKVVEIYNDCTIMTWDKTKKSYESITQADVLLIWNILSERKQFVNKTPKELSK